jgi:DNA-binding transcriptional regulator LsrR (DeoR family)
VASLTPAERNALKRAQRAIDGMEHHLQAIAKLADDRARALEDLLELGWRRSDIARELGVTRQVVTKILQRARRD